MVSPIPTTAPTPIQLYHSRGANESVQPSMNGLLDNPTFNLDLILSRFLMKTLG